VTLVEEEKENEREGARGRGREEKRRGEGGRWKESRKRGSDRVAISEAARDHFW